MGAKITFCWAGRSDRWVVFRLPVIPNGAPKARSRGIWGGWACGAGVSPARFHHRRRSAGGTPAPQNYSPIVRPLWCRRLACDSTTVEGGRPHHKTTHQSSVHCGAGVSPARFHHRRRSAGGTPAPQNYSPIVRPLWGRRLACTIPPPSKKCGRDARTTKLLTNRPSIVGQASRLPGGGWFTVRAPEERQKTQCRCHRHNATICRQNAIS